MTRPGQQDTDAGGAEQRKDDKAPDAQAEADALNDARALQQMIAGTPDSTDEFRRIEQKR
nr:hypothetical protein [uncultured Noviherbaspirillum sp.]